MVQFDKISCKTFIPFFLRNQKMTLMYLAILMIAASPLLCLADVSNVGEPLYLTPYIDAGNIAAAVEASRVVDPCDVTDPEQDCGTRIPESYAGFLTVNKTLDNHLFFWYFPSQVCHSDLPLCSFDVKIIMLRL